MIDDYKFLIHARAGNHRTHFYCSIRLDHVNELPILAGLHGLVGNHDGMGPGRKPEGDADILAGPQLVVFILESAFELNGARSLVHRIVNKR